MGVTGSTMTPCSPSQGTRVLEPAGPAVNSWPFSALTALRHWLQFGLRPSPPLDRLAAEGGSKISRYDFVGGALSAPKMASDFTDRISGFKH